MKSAHLKPFVIVGTQRTGSSLLAATLNDHSDINCGWEWVTRAASPRKVQMVRDGLCGEFDKLDERHADVMKSKPDANVIGFRLLFSSTPLWLISPGFSPVHIRERRNSLLKYLSSDQNVKVIHIVRENIYEWVSSVFLARSSNLYIGKKYPDDLQITVPIGEAEKRVRAMYHLDQKLGCLRDTNPYMEISYESLIADREASAASLFQFLKVSQPKELPAAAIEKQRSRPLSDMISNSDELQMLCSSLSKP